MVQRPDLFNAVFCQNPLLDMMHYRNFPPGASWTGEYGDPEDKAHPEIREAILKYSPYQNVSLSKSVHYPKALFATSIKDDRVHPSHARKMAAKMQNAGHDVLFYESKAGGHATAADIEQSITDSAMHYIYLFQQLMD
jgi:prolyl oligopeptidase